MDNEEVLMRYLGDQFQAIHERLGSIEDRLEQLERSAKSIERRIIATTLTEYEEVVRL